MANQFQYCPNSGSNYKVTIAGKTVWYSYDQIIAFEVEGKRFVSENCFTNPNGRLSTTTAKHINAIEPDKKKRLKRADFVEKLKEYGIMD